ncbi:MAG: hypothetical protein PPP58_02105 [Natronomonas sp.]
MALHSTLATVLTLAGFIPFTLLQTAPESADVDGGLAAFLVLGVVVYALYVALSIGVGVVVLFVSEFLREGSYIGAIERHIYDRPLRSGVVGFGTLVGGFVGFVLSLFVLLVSIELGVPESVVLISILPFVIAVAFVYIGATVGTIVTGAYLLRRLRGGDPNVWIALVVGALVVNLPGLNFVLAFVVLFVGTGAMVDHWWQNRRDGPSESNPPGAVEG